MKGVELLSFQALWFVVAGFVLGFATSTLWEWLYYRGKRRLPQDSTPPASPSLARPVDQPTEREDATATKPATPWAVPYRSPRVYLESEQPASADPVLSPPAPSPATSPTSATLPQSGPPFAQLESKPRLNPATLAALQSMVADAPIAQTPARQVAGIQPLAEQGIANTRVYETPPLAVSATVSSMPGLERQPSPSPASTVESIRVPPAAATISQQSGDALHRAGSEPADSLDHPDNLSMIKGVGDAYKQRLYNAGIYTWRQVAESEPETLRRITRAKPNANINGWRQQARELAEKYQRWHTTFQGPLDDLTRIDGIGAITADILYKAGICTYEQLAGALPDELAQIVPAPTVGDEIDFDGWINAAVRLATTKRRNQGLLS